MTGFMLCICLSIDESLISLDSDKSLFVYEHFNDLIYLIFITLPSLRLHKKFVVSRTPALLDTTSIKSVYQSYCLNITKYRKYRRSSISVYQQCPLVLHPHPPTPAAPPGRLPNLAAPVEAASSLSGCPSASWGPPRPLLPSLRTEATSMLFSE